VASWTLLEDLDVSHPEERGCVAVMAWCLRAISL
jgi:hypothetical protein